MHSGWNVLLSIFLLGIISGDDTYPVQEHQRGRYYGMAGCPPAFRKAETFCGGTAGEGYEEASGGSTEFLWKHPQGKA